MNSLSFALNIIPEQAHRLQTLQATFAQVCNALAPTVREARCWNRVALHHMTYKALRERFPALGSQMVCNAIYAVCQASRLVYQHPDSPVNLTRLGNRPLPLLRFADNCPVYLDRHTLSLKGESVSLFTLEGRMLVLLALPLEIESAFRQKQMREIVLSSRSDGGFVLTFRLSQSDASSEPVAVQELPEYLIVEDKVA